MGRRIEQPPASTSTRRLYPWDQWTDGSWWEITAGEDFTTTIRAMRAMLYGRARPHSGRKLDVRLDAPLSQATRIYFRYLPR